jgi:two-component system, NtrC family, C4-dicarboxylate transport sensor histidine kinase DctB
MRTVHNRTILLLAAIAVALCTVIAVFGSSYFSRLYFNEAAQRGENTLGLAVAALRGEMARYEKLPELIADHEDIMLLAANPDDPELVAEVNLYLKEINGLLESSDIYVMVPDGTTVAASNFDSGTSFVGENFSYRPYFRDALDGGLGRFFALGTTSLKRGYYFGAPIRLEGGTIAGVVVFKVDVDAIEQSWRGADYEIIVTDPEGIIFMTGRQDWMYSGLQPLTEERLARTAETRRYANAPLRDLPVTRSGYENGLELMDIASGEGAREYLVVAEAMPEADWTVKVLLDTASARSQALTTTIVAVLAVALGAMAGAVYLQRRARLRERMHLQREAQEQLERRVAERTADLAALNRQLEIEVAERRGTETQLRKTQSDLVQAGKLAALGQMSAALSHEFNQPLAAAKTYADNALVLIERDRLPEARENIARIQRLRPVLLDEVVTDIGDIIALRLKSAGARLLVDLGDAPLAVKAGSVRLQQVLVNILSNAADAVETLDDRRIHLEARREGDTVLIVIRDHGPGVPDGIIERIFDPFFSTKGVGKGLGLGLSISYNIVKDFGGSLTVSNDPQGGARFLIELEAVDAPASTLVAEPAQ